MNDKTIELLRQMAEKLGTTGEHLWAVLVRQSYIEGGLDLFWFVFLQTVVWVGLAQARKWSSKAKKDKCIEVFVIIWIAWVLLGGFLIPISFVNLHTAIIDLTNPEFSALQEVLRCVQ